MITEKIAINVKGSNVDGAYLTTYIHKYSEALSYNERPLIIVCPGGGYEWLSDREGEILALQFMAMGYHTAVLNYSVKPAVFPTALEELASAIKIIKEHATFWHVQKDQIYVAGCSAGGHLAACLGTMWNKFFLAQDLNTENEVLRPAGMILCYPVITGGEFAHRGSFNALLGEKAQDKEMLTLLSLENQVSKDTVPTFIWHTFTDGSVAVENSLLFVNSLRKFNISTEFHMFPTGGHGCSTGKHITKSQKGTEVIPALWPWLDMVNTWLNTLSKSDI